MIGSTPKVPRPRVAVVAQTAWLSLGSLCVVLGVIGTVMSLILTVFLNAADTYFARSSPRLER